MARLDGVERQGAKSVNSPSSPTFEQLLQGESSSWAMSPASPMWRNGQFEEFHYHHSHNKKSVLAKVRDKAKKWRQTLAKKKHGHEMEEGTKPSWVATLGDDDAENIKNKENAESEEDPEYLGAPMYETELAPQRYKETARQHPRGVTAIYDEHVLASGVDCDGAQAQEYNEQHHCPNKTITHTITAKLAPAYKTVTEATHTMTSKIQNLTIESPVMAAEQAVAPQHGVSGGGNEQMWGSGASVKKYLIQKLEPGEDDRALSQVITEAISPRRVPGELGMMEKVKEAISSLLRAEEPSAAAANSSSHIGMFTSPSDIPISTNAREVFNAESQGRILQAN